MIKAFVKLTNPVIKLFKWVAPSFLIQPMLPFYLAWFFYLFRFYLMPWLLGYLVMVMLSMPLESDFARGVANLLDSSPVNTFGTAPSYPYRSIRR